VVIGYMEDFRSFDFSERIKRAADPACSCVYRRYLVNAGTDLEHTEVRLEREDVDCPVHKGKAV
jgi:hypothetical protein